MNNIGKEHLITAKKRLNSAQLEIQRAMSQEEDDEIIRESMEDTLEATLAAREILDFVMTSYGMEVEDGTE